MTNSLNLTHIRYALLTAEAMGCHATADAGLAQLDQVEEALEAAIGLYERVQMDESVGIGLSSRAETLILGDRLAALRSG